MKIPPDQWHVLTGGYALDAPSGPEREAFARHLRGCASRQAEVRGLRDRRPARPGRRRRAAQPMEQRMLAAAYRIRQLPPPAAGQVYRARRRARRPGPAGERPGRAGRPARTARLLAAVAAAGLAAAIALGVTQSLTQHQPGRAGADNAAITEVLAAPGARTETMPATVGGTVTVVTSRDDQDAAVITEGMPSLTQAQVYQLWVIGPAGLLPRAGQAGRCWPWGSRPATGSGSPSSPPAGRRARRQPRSSPRFTGGNACPL